MTGYIFTLAVIFGGMYWIYKLAHMELDNKNTQYNESDTEIIQELHRGMERMASRIESLETILLDQGEHYRRTPPPTPNAAAQRYQERVL